MSNAKTACRPTVVIILLVVEAVPPKVHVRESVVAFDPSVVGLLRMVTVQVVLVPARSAAPHVSAVIVKFVASVMDGAEHPVAVAVPAFVSVKIWVAEFAATSTSPKS